MDIELIQPDFIEQGIKDIIKDVPPMFRMNLKGGRFYASINDDRRVDWFPSVTSIIGSVVPKDKGILKLMTDMGSDYWPWLNELAHQGTFIHTEIGEFLIKKELNKEPKETKQLYSFHELEDKIYNYMKAKRLNYDTKRWYYKVRTKIASFIRFIEEYEVEPLAIELIVQYKDDKVQFAGALDLLAYITCEEKGEWGEVYKSGARKGFPKETKKKVRRLAIIDFKSGENVYSENELQLMMYRRAFKQMSGIEVDKIMNVNPGKFMEGNIPNYKIKEWDGSDESLLDLYLDLHKVNYKEPTSIATFDKYTTDAKFEEMFSYQEIGEHLLGTEKVKKYLETKELQTV